MHHPPSKARNLARIAVTAALLAAPGLAVAQAPAPSLTQPSPTRPMNPATDPTAPAAISPAAPTATLNAPTVGASPGSAIEARPRISQIIGGRLYNDRDQNVGEVDDILLTATGPMAIVQVGGFLGMGGRLVSLPLGDVRWNADRERLVLPGASKEALEARPAFEYDTTRRR